MNKKIILPILFFLLLVTTALAVPTPTAYWSFDGNTLTDSVGDNDLISTGTVAQSNACIIDTCRNIDDLGDFLSLTTDMELSANGWSINVWYNESNRDSGVVAGIFGNDGGTGDESFVGYRPSAVTTRVYLKPNQADLGTVVPVQTTMGMFSWIFDGTNVFYYVNGTKNAEAALTGVTFNFNRIGETLDGSFSIAAIVDEIGVWNNSDGTKNLTAAHVSELWNGGNGFNPTAPSENIEVTLLSPANDDFNNSGDINFNFNVSLTSLIIDSCALYTNETGSFVQEEINNTPTANVSNNFVHSLADGKYLWNVFCNATTGENAFASANFSLTLDSVAPVISSDFVNDTFFFNNNVSGTFNFTDETQLYSLNVSFNGSQHFYVNNIGSTTYSYNLSVPTGSLPVGENLLSVKIADGHTAIELKDPKNWRSDYQRFNKQLVHYLDGEYDEIIMSLSLENAGLFDTWKTEKKTDRVTEILEPTERREAYVFYFDSTEKVNILYELQGKNDYGGSWIVTGDHWKDFKVKDEPQANIQLQKISDYTVKATITGIKNWERIEFESIGDLNIVTQNYTFFIASATESFSESLLAGFSNPYNLTINYGTLPFSLGIPAAFLEFNGTNYTATLLSSTSTQTKFTRTITPGFVPTPINISHKWHFNLSSYSMGYLETNLTKQTLSNVTVGLCTGGVIYPIANFKYYDEINGERLNITHSYQSKIYDGTYYYNQTGTFGLSDENEFCTNLNPANINYNFDMWGPQTLTASGYVTRIIDIGQGTPTLLSNNPQTNISYFMIATNQSTTITFTWLTTSYAPIDGTMRVFKCEEDGTQSMVESVPVISGASYANLELLNTPYSYDITIDGTLYRDLNSFTRCHTEASTEVLYYVQVQEPEGQQMIGLAGVQCSLQRAALNNTVNMTWGPSTANDDYVQGCIIAERSTISGLVQVYNNCTVEGDGYFRQVTIPSNGNDYVVSGAVKQGNLTVACGEIINFDFSAEGQGQFGRSSLFGVFLLLVGLALMYIDKGPEASMIIVALGLLSSLFLAIIAFSYITVINMVVWLIVIGMTARGKS